MTVELGLTPCRACAGRAMTHIEKMRLQAAMQALRGAAPKHTVVLATKTVDLTVR